MSNPNREILLYRLGRALQILADLEKQLNRNEESFGNAVSGSLKGTYQEQINQAKDCCARIKNQLSQLQAEEQVRL